MMARVSSAAGDSRRGRSANCARSSGSAYSARVRNCQPPAISASSTPCASSPNAARSSASAARTASSPASGSSVASSTTVSGREAANSAASSSFARGLTADHHGGEGGGLAQRQRAALRQLEQREERRQDFDDPRARIEELPPAELVPLGEQGLDPARGTLD